MAERPLTYNDLLNFTGISRPELTQVLESLLFQGSIGKTSDGFQTLYFLVRTRSQ
jgi:DNA-binding transcriptional regulator GbsR (MarR family)